MAAAAAASSPMLPALLMLFMAFAAATTGAAETTTTTTALDETCAFLGGWYVTPELCASVLCADPSPSPPPCRAARDAPAVAALAARLAARNATATKASVQASLAAARARAAGNATAGAGEVARGIDSCLQLYAGVVPALQWAAESVAAGRYRGARQVLDAAQYVPGGCEGMAGDAAALPRENGAFSYVAMVAHAVVASMVGD